MDPFLSYDKRLLELDRLQQEIIQLEVRMAEEKSATTLNDIRLRLRFLKWKKELLAISFSGSKR